MPAAKHNHHWPPFHTWQMGGEEDSFPCYINDSRIQHATDSVSPGWCWQKVNVRLQCHPSLHIAIACRLQDSLCLGDCTDFLSLVYKEDDFSPFTGTLNLSISFPVSHEILNGFIPPSNHQPGCPPGTTWGLFQAGISTQGALLKQCCRAASLTQLHLPVLPCRQDSSNTVVKKCLQHGRENHLLLPSHRFPLLPLLLASRSCYAAQLVYA